MGIGLYMGVIGFSSDNLEPGTYASLQLMVGTLGALLACTLLALSMRVTPEGPYVLLPVLVGTTSLVFLLTTMAQTPAAPNSPALPGQSPTTSPSCSPPAPPSSTPKASGPHTPPPEGSWSPAPSLLAGKHTSGGHRHEHRRPQHDVDRANGGVAGLRRPPGPGPLGPAA